MRIGLVGCGKQKAATPMPACQLYTSALFQRAAAYCLTHYDQWYILSALYGLVEPTATLAPYEHTLVGRLRAEREAWAERVVEDLGRRGLRGATFYVHA